MEQLVSNAPNPLPSMMQERERRRPRNHNQRGAAGEIIARTAVKASPRASLAGNNAEAVVLDFVQPLAAGWQLIGFGWEARRDEPSSGWENLVARDQAGPAGTPLVAR